MGGIGVVISLVAQVVYAGINGWLWNRCRHSLKSENSPLMASQAKLFYTKLFGNIFIPLSLSLSLLLAEHEWSVIIDPIASLVTTASILTASTPTSAWAMSSATSRRSAPALRAGSRTPR